MNITLMIATTTLAGAMTAAPAALAVQPALSTVAHKRLVRQVRHELVMLPYYSVFDRLVFRIEGYHVTLLGHVTRPTLMRDAEQVVKSIEGVESVTNLIEVLPLSPNDDRIRAMVFRAIYSNGALRSSVVRPTATIHIIVKNGDVTLHGAVAREMDKTIAGMQANSAPGVFSVTNNLRVDVE